MGSSYADWYASGPYARLRQSHHATAGGARLFRVVDRPAGSYVEPPMPRPTLQIALHGRGACRLDLGGGVIRSPLRNDAWVVAPAQTQCRYELEAPIELLVVEFPDAAWAETPDAAPDLAPLHARLSSDPLTAGLARRLWMELDSVEGLGSLWADQTVCVLAGLVQSTASAARTPAPRGALAPWRARRVRDQIESDFAEPLSLADLARTAGLSAFHFARAFRATFGCTPDAYRRRVRVAEARRLLETTDASVTEIALTVGYESSQAFARVFRQLTGSTPQGYRCERRR